eukprot:TRINITY_DN26220_c0_g1_i1.p1 TRINITY_DN26220_c0_g1~~TRINITY_DN26220_c0_g1_i1.p1  ORF type:complete len:751 (+),score=87.31 TRINITY_DN26220_c0_g1_i1:71-2254(+)
MAATASNIGVRTRAAADDATCRIPPVPVPSRSRPGFVQGFVSVIVLCMTVVLVCMYRTITDLHSQQQDLRLQIHQLGSALTDLTTGSPVSGDSDDTVAPAVQKFLPMYQRRTFEEKVENLKHGADDPAKARMLGAMYTTGTAATFGCLEIHASNTPQTYDVSVATTCGTDSGICGDCYITPSGGLTADVTVKISSCSGAKWIRSATRSGVWEYTFINLDDNNIMTVTDSSTGGVNYKVPPHMYVKAWCSSGTGTTDKLAFPSSTIPTLTVDSGLTVSGGNFDMSGSTGTFQTGSGAITLSGDVGIASGKTLTTGSTGAVSIQGPVTVADGQAVTIGGSAGGAGLTTVRGHVVIGEAAAGTSLTVYGNIEHEDPTAAPATFSTATGAISLNGDVDVNEGKYLKMKRTGVGNGAFETATGAVDLYGDVTVRGTKTFTSGSGAFAINGETTIAATKGLTVGAAGSGGNTIIYGSLQVGASGSSQATGLTVYGPVVFDDGASAGTSTFATGTGAITLNGDTSLASAKNLAMHSTSAGTFTTGTGAVSLNGATTISGANTFTTGTGNVIINGDTTITASKSFTVGATDTGGMATFLGHVTIGTSTAGTAKSDLTIYGDIDQQDRLSGNQMTFSTATGAISLNGNIAVAQGKDLIMSDSGSGIFTTGTGPVTLNSATTINGAVTVGPTPAPSAVTAGTVTAATVSATSTFNLGGSAVACNNAETGGASTFCKV